MPQTSKDELLGIIRNAFATDPLPAKISSSHYGGSEGEELDQLLSGKKWDQIKLNDFLERFSDAPAMALNYLSEEAFEYYYPCFLTLSLEHYPADYGISETINFSLRTDVSPLLFAKTSTFSLPHKKAVARYLFHVLDSHKDSDASLALEQYWKQFL